MQCLQIQLIVGLGWNKASGGPLHGLGYGLGISEIILVPLPKRGAPSPDKPPAYSESRCGGGSAAGPSHSRHFGKMQNLVAIGA